MEDIRSGLRKLKKTYGFDVRMKKAADLFVDMFTTGL